jgi:D-alanyl-lipoteichoic acid acyltransferase DltB (MBOAT superfamily)
VSHWPTPKRQSIFERLRAISIVLVFCSYFLLSIYIRSHLEGSDSRLCLKTPFVLGSGYIALQAVDLLAKPYLIYFSYSIPEKVGYLIYSPQFAAGPVEKSRSLISALRSPIIVSNSKRLESSFKYLIPGLLRKAILVPIIYSIFSSTKESASSLGLIGSALAFPIPYLYLYQEIQAYTEIAQGVSALAERVMGLLRRAEFKRRQAPPVLKLSQRAFGSGWRMPIAARG